MGASALKVNFRHAAQMRHHGQRRRKISATAEQLIRDLARLLPDGSIASGLNRLGVQSANGHTWTQLRVRNVRAEHRVAVYREGERADWGELILHEAAAHLGVSKMSQPCHGTARSSVRDLSRSCAFCPMNLGVGQDDAVIRVA